MIDLYTWKVPNGRKVSIMLEEIKLPYNVILVNIGAGEQFSSTYLKVNPNNKVPAIIDHEGPDGKPLTLFESGAILIYLAEKTGKLLAADKRQRAITIQWLMFQMAGLGPMAGQAHHFRKHAQEQIPYAIKRYTEEAKRLYNVLNKRLDEVEYLADEYSIADIACYPWIALHEMHGINLADYSNVQRWFDKISARHAVQKGMAVPNLSNF